MKIQKKKIGGGGEWGSVGGGGQGGCEWRSEAFVKIQKKKKKNFFFFGGGGGGGGGGSGHGLGWVVGGGGVRVDGNGELKF